MLKKQTEKPLTLNDLAKYNNEVLFPALEERFVTKSEFFEFKDEFFELKKEFSGFKDEFSGLKKEFFEFKDQSFTYQDAILKKLDILLQEKDVAYYQYKQQKKFNKIVAKSLEKHSILTPAQTNEIKELGVL